ncbi:hypothetical protein [Desulfonatronum lacustre]|uniref:hypothetical protein n=1 Tax=Desulfonatronum lacustre TaxID=66849 RepID=UPI0004B2A42D|nr:hypothetical protein [Desulfonatronum lacustre]
MQREEWKRLYRQELGFFAAISASVTHEIKNHLAIINEQNGLLGDMLAMDADDGPAYRKRLGKVVQDVADQVIKADGVVRRFNTFAHTADSPVGAVDVADFLKLFGEISARLARRKGATVLVEPGAECVTIRTRPFELLHLLFCAMNVLLGSGTSKGALRLRLESDSEGIRVRMSGNGGNGAAGAQASDPALALLLQRLQARLVLASDGTGLTLGLPMELVEDREKTRIS